MVVRPVGLLCLLVMAGCYQYVPVGEAVPERGKEVRVHLSPSQDIELGEVVVRDVTAIDGFVYRATPDSIDVSSVWLRSLLGHRYGTNGDVYYLNRGEVSDVQVRALHPAKSVVAVAGIVAGSFGLFTFIADAGSDPGSDGDKGDVNPNVVSVIIP